MGEFRHRLGVVVNNGGQREFTYTKLLFLFIEGIAGNMEQALLSAAPFFTIKLHRFAKQASSRPRGCHPAPEGQVLAAGLYQSYSQDSRLLKRTRGRGAPLHRKELSTEPQPPEDGS